MHVALEEARIAAVPVARVGRLRFLLLRCARDHGMVVAGRVVGGGLAAAVGCGGVERGRGWGGSALWYEESRVGGT